jgi:hypothetical protein
VLALDEIREPVDEVARALAAFAGPRFGPQAARPGTDPAA